MGGWKILTKYYCSTLTLRQEKIKADKLYNYYLIIIMIIIIIMMMIMIIIIIIIIIIFFHSRCN